MAGTLRHIINMANSIIGVSILSMPYCFKEAGLVLGIILILISGFITKKTCMFLIKAAIMSRRRSYELLAFQVFGVTGKLLMEMCMILFLVGICISFHVVMGDLAPAIAAKYMIIENSPSLRCTILVGMVLLVILPLCLLRNIDSLASMSACSIGFYVFLNCIIFYMALPNLLDGSWFAKAKLFHFYSAFRVLPIMTLALSCQSNVFEIYDSIPDPDVIKMKSVVSQAVNICCALYIGVGFLGYVAFVDTDITGNVIMKFPISNMTDCITIFFVFSLAISFPLMMFPCRTSIHSLIYKRNTQISYDIVGNYMPEIRFKGITVTVLISSLVLGILLPNIEYVLGLLGSTMGVTIALILPSIFYIKVYTKTSCDRLLAQGLLLLGIFIMVTGTYLHLNGLHNTETSVSRSPPVLQDVAKRLKELPDSVKAVKEAAPEIRVNPVVNDDAANSNIRKEPVVPEPPNMDAANMPNKIIEPVAATHEKKVEPAIDRKIDDTQIEKQPEKIEKVGDLKPLQKDIKEEGTVLKMENKKEEILHPDAIQKEEKEKVEENIGKDNIEQKQEEILKKMESQQKEQKLIIEEQKKILKELIVQKEKIDEVVGNPQISKDKEEVKEDKKKNLEVPEKPLVEDKKIERSLDNIPPQKIYTKEKVDLQNQVLDNLKVVQPPQKIVQQDQQNIANGNAPNNNNNILQPHSLNIINDKIQAQPNVKKDLNIKLKDSNNLGLEVKRSSLEENRLSNTKVKNPIKKVIKESNIVKKSIKVSDDDPSLKHDEERKKRDISYVKLINEKEKISNERNIELNEVKNIANGVDNLRGPNPETKIDQDIKSKIDGNDNQKLAKKIDLDINKKHSLDDADNLVKEINHLSYDEDVKLGDDNQQAVVQENKPNFDPLFESRHLLWLSRRTRRRKRRHEQFPEYWDEI